MRTSTRKSSRSTRRSTASAPALGALLIENAVAIFQVRMAEHRIRESARKCEAITAKNGTQGESVGKRPARRWLGAFSGASLELSWGLLRAALYTLLLMVVRLLVGAVSTFVIYYGAVYLIYYALTTW